MNSNAFYAYLKSTSIFELKINYSSTCNVKKFSVVLKTTQTFLPHSAALLNFLARFRPLFLFDSSFTLVQSQFSSVSYLNSSSTPVSAENGRYFQCRLSKRARYIRQDLLETTPKRVDIQQNSSNVALTAGK